MEKLSAIVTAGVVWVYFEILNLFCILGWRI